MSYQKTDFETWWDNEGSRAPEKGDDIYEHCKRMCGIAWAKGKATTKQKHVAWMMLNSSGDEISITESNLRHHQPAFVQELWKDATPLCTTPQQRKPLTDAATVAGLHASIGHLSALVDHQYSLLQEVNEVCGRDGHGGDLEDGESDLIDRVRQHLKAIVAPQNVGHGNAEDQYIAMNKYLNCPHCGGSGHIDDANQEQCKPVAALFEDGSIVKMADLEFVPEKSGQRVQMLVIAAQTTQQNQPDLDAICQDLQEKTYTQAMRIAELEEALAKQEQSAEHVGEPVAQHRDLHSHMMVVAHRAADSATKNGQQFASQKEIVRAICSAIQSDKKLIEKLCLQPAQPKVYQQEQGEPVGEMQLSAIYEGMVVPVVPVELPAGTKLYTTPQQRKPQFKEFIKWAGSQGYDCAQTCNSDTGEWIVLNPMTAGLWKAWQAAHGIKE